MPRLVYYSPFGGAVQAILQMPDANYELAVLQGTLRKTTIDDDHEIARHIDAKDEPTNLDRLIVAGERLQRRGG